jgi:Carboxypeptidase regulatory-like domain
MNMQRMTRTLWLCVIVCVGYVPLAAAQTQTGTVEGKVVDQQGAVLPGVNITLTGPRGSQSTVTDADGMFRFVGVVPATYALKAELTGFLTESQPEVIVGLGKTVTAEFSLKVGGVSETVEVTAASTVDVRSSATHTNISNDMLTLTPIYSPTSTGLLNYAPGINNSSAYGAQGSYGNALLMDGVDTRDPQGGSAWTFFNQNMIQEIQVGGLGAPAEYGGFTGAIINTVTKSGGNAFSGLFSLRYTGDSLAADNLSNEILASNASLGQSAVTTKLIDYTVAMGGPLKKDKAFFFANVQRYQADTDPTGPIVFSQDISPRFNTKFTLQPTSNDTFVFGLQYDTYNVKGRQGFPVAKSTDQQTVTEDAPEWVWNAQWRKVMGTKTFLEAKFTGYDGYYYLDPVDPSPFTYDGLTDEYTGGGGGLEYEDRSRNQVQVALTRYAEAFGRHSLKFGAEIERSHVGTQYQPYGPAGFYIYAYGGVPYYRINYGYTFHGDNKRLSAYAQDSWTAGRLTMNLGLRLDRIRGYSPDLKKDVYTPGLAWGPRLGAAYDLTGKGASVIRGFYGRYFEGTATQFFIQATPGIQDYVQTPLNPDGSVAGPGDVVTPGFVYGISDDINHPRTDEFNVAWENQVTRTSRLTVSGIWRTTGNFVNNVINGSQWRPVTLNNSLTNTTFTGYNWSNRSTTDQNFFIRNVEDYQYIDTSGNVIGTADPRRNYKALMILYDSAFRRRLGYQLSYVLAKAEGNVDNTGFGNWLGGTQWGSPNTGLINAYGELTNSRRHELKLNVEYNIPRIDVMLGGVYTGESGRPYTPFQRYTNTQLNLPTNGRKEILLEPRGSERNDFYNNFDLRAEKAFRVQTHRFGVFADLANLFNTATVITRQARVPNTTISGSTVLYGAPTAVQTARQITFGGRWSF